MGYDLNFYRQRTSEENATLARRITAQLHPLAIVASNLGREQYDAMFELLYKQTDPWVQMNLETSGNSQTRELTDLLGCKDPEPFETLILDMEHIPGIMKAIAYYVGEEQFYYAAGLSQVLTELLYGRPIKAYYN